LKLLITLIIKASYINNTSSTTVISTTDKERDENRIGYVRMETKLQTQARYDIMYWVIQLIAIIMMMMNEDTVDVVVVVV